MSGVKSPNTGIGGGLNNTYDYLQHTTIHPQPNPPPQQHLAYYPQQHGHDPGSYPSTHEQHQYYHQPQYYQQQQPQEDLSQQQGSWSSNSVENNQYHQPQPYYQQQLHPEYHQNQSYQQPPIHQLNSFVNNPQHPQSTPPPATGMYPTSGSTGYASQASPSSTVPGVPLPQRSLSPIRSGAASPGAASNHMMPVRLQNMAKGARTKAGMRKLLQMEQQGQSAQMQVPEKSPAPSPAKKPRVKKSPATPPSADHETSSTSVDESIESVVFSVIPNNAKIIPTTNPSPVHLQTPAISSLPQTSMPNNPTLSTAFSSATPKFSADDREPFFRNQIPHLPQFKTPNPSDLLYEKLGLSQEEEKRSKKKKSKVYQKKTQKGNNSQSKPVTENEKGSMSPKRTRQTLTQSSSMDSPSSPKRKRIESSTKGKQSSFPEVKRGLTPRKLKDSVTPKSVTKKSMLKSESKRPSRQTLSKSPQKNSDCIGTSIAEVAAAIIQPMTDLPIKLTSVPESEPTTSVPAVRIKRKYTKRDPIRWKSLQKNGALPPMQKKGLPLQKKTVLPLQKKGILSLQKKGVLSSQKVAGAKLKKKKLEALGIGPEISVIPIETLTPVKATKKSAALPSSPLKKTPKEKKSPKEAKTQLKPEKSESELWSPLESLPEITYHKSKPEILNSSTWIDTVNEKRLSESLKLKKPTVWGKAATAGQTGGVDCKKEPGPSLKVKKGVVKFYRGNVEEDVDEALKKLEVVLKDNITNVDCDEEGPWLCTFCGLGPHDMRLGDLFGPYFVQESSSPKLRTKTESAAKKTVWVHTDCALWAGDVILVGSTLRNLDEAVFEAGKVMCNICRHAGATIGCLKRGCRETAHFPCAKLNDWSLNEDTFHSHCKAHYPNPNPNVLQQKSMHSKH